MRSRSTQLQRLAFTTALLCMAGWMTAPAQPQPCEPSADPKLAEACELIRARNWREADDLTGALIKEDPENLEARLLRGIARRELERGLPLSWSNLRDFEFVIDRDSTFQDVLYEYAVALTYREGGKQERRALALAERQIDLKPELVEPRLGIFDLYRYVVRANRPSAVLRLLDARDSDYARFFTAEVHRREGRLSTADSAHAELFERAAASFPRIPIQLARARIQFERENDAAGQQHVEEAMDSIASPLDAYLVFRDFKYVLSPDEASAFSELEQPGEMQSFLRTIFEKRDPMPAEAVNSRLAEHYRRLVRAERHFIHFGTRNWTRHADRFRRLSFPPTFYLADEFDDRGIIYLRLGEADEEVRHVDGNGVHGESWRYARLGMDFHFRTETSMSPTLQPLPFLPLLGEVAMWDGDYRGLARYPEHAAERIVQKSIRYVTTGMTTDQFDWTDAATPIEMPVITALFRSEGGTYDLYAFYALPAGELSRGLAGSYVPLHIGAALYDSSWSTVHSTLDTKRIPRTDDATAAAIDLHQIALPAGTYHFAMHVREPERNRVAAVRAEIDAPPYDDLHLAMSDIVPAFEVRPTSGGGRYVRNGLYLSANPTLNFGGGRPLHVYFEVYNLTYGADDRTKYSVEYRLESHEKHGGFLGLFGGDIVTLSVAATGEGVERSPAEHGEIDVADVPRGRYDLTVTVRDETSGHSVSRTRELLLVD